MSRKTAVATKPAKASKAHVKAPVATKAPRKARAVIVEPEPEVEEHHGLTGIASRNRTTADGGLPAKHQLFALWLKDPVGTRANVERVAAKFPHIQLSTIKSWFSNWSLGLDGGGFYPASLRGREKELAVALAKIAKARKA